MTFEQALAELQVTHGVAADDLRRAYLRAVKRHPPEKDPEGFRRVREAYERVRGTAMEVLPEFEREPTASNCDDAVFDPGPESPTLETIAIEPSNAGEPRAAAADELPEPTRVYDHGDTDFADDYEQPSESFEASPDQTFEFAALEALLAERRNVDAARVAIELLDKAARDASMAPRADQCLELMLNLLKEGKVALSRDLQKAFRDWLAGAQPSARMLWGETAARWLLLDELMRIHAAMPDFMRDELIDVVRTSDARRGLAAIDSLARINARRARRVVKDLEKHAPNLCALIGRPRISRSAFDWTWLLRLAVPLLLLFPKFFYPKHAEDVHSQTGAASAPPPAHTQSAERPAIRHVDVVVERGGELGREDVRVPAVALGEALRSADCARARAALHDLKAALLRDRDDELERETTLAEQEMPARCRATEAP